MKVLHAAAEVFPLVKTGGLADVLGALPQALVQAGADVRLVLPGLPAIKAGVEGQTLVRDIGAIFGAGRVSLWIGRLGRSGVLAYVVDAPFLYQLVPTLQPTRRPASPRCSPFTTWLIKGFSIRRIFICWVCLPDS